MSGIADGNREKFTAVWGRPGIEVFAARTEDGRPVMSGYAATFTGLSEDLGGFRVRVAGGAFDDVLTRCDCRLLVNHNPDLIMGRTKSGTLKLSADDRGLAFEGFPPDTPLTAHYMEEINRGDIDGCSFTCFVKKDRWDLDGEDVIRTILEIGELLDVGPVSFPAFPDTKVSATLQASLDRARAAARPGRCPGARAIALKLRLEQYRLSVHV